MQIFVCKCCGKKRQTARLTQKFCSKECYLNYRDTDEYRNERNRQRVIKEYQKLLMNANRLDKKNFIRLMSLAKYLGRDLEESIGENERLKKMHTSLLDEGALLEEADAREKMKPEDIPGDPFWINKNNNDDKLMCEVCLKRSINCHQYEIYEMCGEQERVVGETGFRCTRSKCKYSTARDEKLAKLAMADSLYFRKLGVIKCEVCGKKDGALHRYKIFDKQGAVGFYITRWRHFSPTSKKQCMQ